MPGVNQPERGSKRSDEARSTAELTGMRGRINDLERELKPWRGIKGFVVGSTLIALIAVAGYAVVFGLDYLGTWISPALKWVAVILACATGLAVIIALVWSAPMIGRALSRKIPDYAKDIKRNPKAHRAEAVGVILWIFWIALITYLFNKY